nr:transposase zinc-binding domain-containing protein [Paenibacillus piri]
MKQIFFDEHRHWEAFIEKHKEHIRSNVLKEVQKFRSCGDPKNGFKLLVCEGCHDIRRVPSIKKTYLMKANQISDNIGRSLIFRLIWRFSCALNNLGSVL